MKKHLKLLSAAIIMGIPPLSAFANAEITFEQTHVPSSITSPTTVKGAGIDGLKNRDTGVPAEGTFTIDNDAQGRVVNTNISIENMNANHAPVIPSGSVGWSSEGASSYTFTVSAGGNPGKWDPKQTYCVTVFVNGQNRAKNCTDSKEYWSPTVVHGITLNQSTKIKVVIDYSQNNKMLKQYDNECVQKCHLSTGKSIEACKKICSY